MKKIICLFILTSALAVISFAGCDDTEDSTREEVCENMWSLNCNSETSDTTTQEAAANTGWSEDQFISECVSKLRESLTQEEINCGADADSCSEFDDCI